MVTQLNNVIKANKARFNAHVVLQKLYNHKLLHSLNREKDLRIVPSVDWKLIECLFYYGSL